MRYLLLRRYGIHLGRAFHMLEVLSRTLFCVLLLRYLERCVLGQDHVMVGFLAAVAIPHDVSKFQRITDNSRSRWPGACAIVYPSTHRRPSCRGTRCLRFSHLILRSRTFSKCHEVKPAATASSPSHRSTGTYM